MASWYVGARATPALCQVVLLHPSSFLGWQKELGGKGLLEVSGLLPYLKHGSFQNFRMVVWALCKVSGFPALTAYVPQIFRCLPWGLASVPRLCIPILHGLFGTVEQFSTFIPHKKNSVTFGRWEKVETEAQVSIKAAESALRLSKCSDMLCVLVEKMFSHSPGITRINRTVQLINSHNFLGLIAE